MNIEYSLTDSISESEIVELYEANEWSSAKKPKELLSALRGSHSLVTARIEKKLVGVGNAISDGHLVVYYPHILVHPSYHRKGIGKGMMELFQSKYSKFHQQMLTADGDAVQFYENLGFEIAGRTKSMWIYQGNEH